MDEFQVLSIQILMKKYKKIHNVFELLLKLYNEIYE